MKRLTQLLVLAAFMFSCGGQWYVLQAVAWVHMIYDYSQVVPLTEAVSMTFSGKYPCEICKAIADKKQSEQSRVIAIEKYEKKFFPPLSVEIVELEPSLLHYPAYSISFRMRTESPPTPPPRLFLNQV